MSGVTGAPVRAVAGAPPAAGRYELVIERDDQRGMRGAGPAAAQPPRGGVTATVNLTTEKATLVVTRPVDPQELITAVEALRYPARSYRRRNTEPLRAPSGTFSGSRPTW
jgi:hypothetical protein